MSHSREFWKNEAREQYLKMKEIEKERDSLIAEWELHWENRKKKAVEQAIQSERDRIMKGIKEDMVMKGIKELSEPRKGRDWSMESNRKRGDRFERKVKAFLEKEGFFVVRQSGSQFPDLIAIGIQDTLAVECKTRGNLSEEEEHKLTQLSCTFGLRPMMAYKDKDTRRMRIVQLADVPLKESDTLLTNKGEGL